MNNIEIKDINWEKIAGLIPAIIQDFYSKQVLMLGYMNKESLALTLQTGFVTFYSRTRKEIWKKGETSGDFLMLKDISLDCDNDSLLVLVEPKGNTCHKGSFSCFNSIKKEVCDLSFLIKLENVLDERCKLLPEGSYTTKLVKEGINRISQKVGEEAVEMIISASTNSDNFLEEAADLMYHFLLLLRVKEKNLKDVIDVLQTRNKK